MFMRMVQVKVRPEEADQMIGVYSDSIIPALQKTPGCMYASLIRSSQNSSEAISMTLWDSIEHAEAYEHGGLFQQLMGQIAPYLSDSSEWKIQLSKDFTWEYIPTHEEPVVKSYKVTTSFPAPPSAGIPSKPMYVRILSVRLKPGKLEEFASLYNAEILPMLQDVHGCRYAFLTEGVAEQNEILSVTIWDSKEAADTYEESGLFRKLTRKVEHTFSEIYQWKLSVEKRSSMQVASTEDMNISGYNLVSGKVF
ncbi:MAG TPA: antibiotic biosynthesis monooxygenase [Bacteroidota bacterium]|nr:antibiotic biosynthesis monooxygenase [Bacteroidota bacterium]